jgi:hypothetical protein
MSGGLNPAGIPNAFAALLEATVFKDRLAAGNNHHSGECWVFYSFKKKKSARDLNFLK